ncbi:MAG: heme-binding domain-containing protein [Bacteroidia bacterium]|nr:heme-binding domain-containing protein [Bacteroidia bacterium]
MNSSWPKKIAISLAAILIILQFVQPARNLGSATGENDIAHTVTVPDNVQQILTNSCFDCHSNATNYPWYASIQPLGFWLKHHVDEGKSELNFSEFKTYTEKRKAKKFREIAEELEEDKMPLPSYTWVHKGAILTPEQKTALLDWAKSNQLGITN